MHGDMFIFDNVVHMYDNRPDNVIDPTAMNYQAKFHKFLETPDVSTEAHPGSRTEVSEALKLMFEKASVDLAMAQTVPLFSYWREGFAPARLQYELHRAEPARVFFCGGVDPVFQGLSGALEEMERQISEWGATSMKFYQGHRAGLSWRADDRRIAYPLWEKCLELGVSNVQFHKGIPLGHEYVEDLRPNDVQQAAIDFPEMTFVLHHFGVPYLDETINIASRFENVWLSISAMMNFLPVAPWTFYDAMGKALRQVGADRIVWGSEAFAYPSIQAYIEAFAEFQIPEEMQDRFGYPSISETEKRKILGLNFAGLLEIDVEHKLRSIHPGASEELITRAAMGDTP